jgi:transketolase
MNNKIFFFERKEINKILKLKINQFLKAEILATMCRLNTLSMIKRAGSGHIGTSFSAMDLFVWIKFFRFKTSKTELKNLNRNIFFSSKGHDAPALYSVLYALNIISLKKILNLRRLGGLDGHPDVSIPGIESNTGSLGMGISKGKGYLWAKRYLKKKGNVVLIVGDGEFQEGQIFESLQTAAHQKLNDLIVIMDHNKIQSSQYVNKIIDLRDLKKKITSFGWHVDRCDGHNFKKMDNILLKFLKIRNKPKFLIADTIKGKGVDFMEHTKVMKANKYYNWHAGAPNESDFQKAQSMLLKKIDILQNKVKINKLKITDVTPKEVNTNNIEIH